MNDETIYIKEPSVNDMTFLPGESRILKYKVRTITDFKVKDLVFTLETLVKERDSGEVRKTKYKYANIIKTPKVLYPGKDHIVEVEVKLPLEYKEYVTKEDGDMAKQPFRIKLHVKGIEHIEEL